MFKMKSILLITIFIYCSSCEFECPIQFRSSRNLAAEQGDVIIQRITKSIPSKGNGLFWWNDQNALIYLAERTIYVWRYQTGKIRTIDLHLDERLEFLIPIKNKRTLAVVASDNKLRILTWNINGNYSLSHPIQTIPDKGYVFKKGHCDSNGLLYALAYKPGIKNSHSKMYKINKSGKINEIKTFCHIAMDFAIDPHDNKKFYVIADSGKNISLHDYDMNTEKLSEGEHIFEAPQTTCHTTMTGIDVDTHNTIWVSAHGHPGRVIAIDLHTRKVKKVVMFPHNNPYQLTWGGFETRNLFVGFDKSCNLCDNQSGDNMVIASINETGAIDNLYDYDTE